ncbi:magnesium transporter MgtE N-terminal domain-containing protein [Intrasporangium sp.]|uniref:magnesium transporter MgtE N-terminal domain-containing protein n=1 Tax=Intrasporangium sp. TaxID=1925024 RepID=UPI002939EE55|nr:CBS domain-containing protein [Intrasporangium sp.]MDV3221425.1 CBS domain-containing protein [Intrasporangium sp.]
MSASTRVFVARLTGLSVFDPLGDQVGRVRDVVVMFTRARPEPRVIGLVVEVPGRRRVFVPMTRVTSIDAGAVITTGLVNMRRFEQRTNETLVAAELFDRTVTVTAPDARAAGFDRATVEDVAIEQSARRDWYAVKVFVRQAGLSSASRAMSRLTRRRSGKTMLVDIHDVAGLHDEAPAQSAERLLETYDDLKVADLAEVIHDLNPKRRAEVAAVLDDERLADILEELPEDDQVEIIAGLDNARAADVLEAMEPDDAADLLADLPPEQAEQLLQLMEPDEAAPLRRLLSYDEKTAGGMMTTEPVILAPEATIAEALAMVRREELAPALATMVYVCRPPLEAPTGRYLGLVHIQRLLRDPPHAPVGSIIDKEMEPLPAHASLEHVTRTLATYNLVSLPVVDDDGRLLGAVTVDDVLDHILPEDWREERHELEVKP